MLELFLHPGPGKTGSSSIQNAMMHQESGLLEDGILIPKTYRSVSGDFHQFSELIKSASSENKKSLDLLQAAVESISQEAENSGAKKIVISSDFLTNLSPKETSLINNLFISNKIKVKIVIYKRNLYKLAVSTLQQQIQNGKHINNFYAYRPFTYFNMMKAYSDAFGHESIIVRDYLFDEDRSWSVVSDFYTEVLKTSVNSEGSAWINKSLGADALQLMNYFNYFFIYPTPLGHAKIAEALRWSILNIEDIGKRKPTLSKEEISAIAEIFAYDEEQFNNFMPDISPYQGGRISKIPTSVLGASFNESICKSPSRESLDTLFATLGSYMSNDDLISQLDRNAPA